LIDQLPPNSKLAESAVLSACLVDKDSYYAARQALKAECFYSGLNARIFNAMIERDTNDVSTLVDALGNDPDTEHYIIGLTADYSGSGIEEPVAVIIEKYTRRKIIDAARRAAADAMNNPDVSALDIANQLHQGLYDASEQRDTSKPQKIGDMLPEIFNHVEALSKMAGHKVKSGLVDLDRDTGGFGPGELTIIAGRPAMGKSTLADTIIRYNGIILRHPVAVFSLEMSRILCGARMLFAEASLSYHTARQGLLPKREFDELGTASELLMTAPIWIDDSPDLTTTHIITKCNYIKAQTGISLIVVDYLQLMGSLSKGESRQEQISKISRGLKGISKIFDCPVIALSQLSREVEKRSPPIPMMSDLRESGAIEQDADAVLMLYRDDYYNGESKNPGITDIIIGKQRNGPVGTVSTKFDGKAMRFLNLVKENEPERIVNERDYGPF